MKQKTIKQKASYSGIGLHKGEMCELEFCPALINTGIIFQRVDLEGEPQIPVLAQYVVDTSRGTTIGKDNVLVYTVEHILAAVHALGITNLLIKINGIEPPAADGSCAPFVETLKEAGLVEEKEEVECLIIEEPVWVRDGEKYIVALPSDKMRISFTLQYDHPVVGTQYCDVDIAEDFLAKTARARTFGFYNEIEYLKAHGLALGGSLENAIVVGDDAPLNPLRFPDEFVQHKVLDMMGDLMMVGRPVRAHFVGVKSGHDLNSRLAKALREKFGL